MSALELFGALGAELLHQEKHDVCDVALDELIHETWSLDLVKNWINLVGLGTHILKYVVHFG